MVQQRRTPHRADVVLVHNRGDTPLACIEKDRPNGLGKGMVCMSCQQMM